jgi:nucleotide-binding universal stress UspA family protein
MSEIRTSAGARRRPVVVAVDGSAYARAAAEWAAEEALRRGTSLSVVTVVESMAEGGRLMAEALSVGADHPAAPALALLDDTATGLMKAHPGLVVEQVGRMGEPVLALEELSDEAAVLVVGSRGRGGFAGLAVGSVSMHLTLRSRCPLVVVPRGHRAADHPGPTVVGVDAHMSLDVLRYGTGHVMRTGGRLRVVHAWNPYPAHSAAYVSDTDITARRAQERIAERLAVARRGQRALRAEIKVLRGRPADVLIAQSADADLAVVGSHHRWLTLPGAVGPVLHELLVHAECPVAVVPVR